MTMKTITRTIIRTLALLALAATAGCASYKLDPPTGFVEVERNDYSTRLKAAENVGLSVRVFDNHKGGTLAFWSEDLVHKLGARGYRLETHSPARSANGVAGTRLDFSYATPGDDPQAKFYSAVLFVTDGHRVVMQLAGDDDQRERHLAQLDAIAGELKVRGCKPASDVCKGPQPRQLATRPEAGEPAPEGS